MPILNRKAIGDIYFDINNWVNKPLNNRYDIVWYWACKGCNIILESLVQVGYTANVLFLK